MHHIWSVLCEKTATDQDSGNMSLLNVVEQLNVSSSLENLTQTSLGKSGVVRFNLILVSLWIREDNELDKEIDISIKLSFIDPDGKELGSTENNTKVQPNHKRIKTRFKIENFKVIGPGTYKIKIHQKDGGEFKEVASVPLEINFKPLPKENKS